MTPPAPAAVVLEAAEFWHLRAVASEAQRIALEARAQIAAAQAAQQTLVAALAAKYGFDPAEGLLRLNDQTLTLTVEAAPAAATDGA